MSARIDVTVFNDPGCPWGYSANPALRVLEWRYGVQLQWRLVLIGLTEDAQQYVDRGYTPLASAQGHARFRRFGMPIAPEPKSRVSATSPACRAVVAARIDAPGSEWEAHRAIQLAQFTSDLVLEDRDGLGRVVGAALVDRIDDADVRAAYEQDRAEARTAAGTPGALQGKTATTDGVERYTAPSLVFERDGRRLEATGFQPVEAYDVLLANLDPTLERRPAPDDAGDVLAAFDFPLATQEVAAILAQGNDAVDRAAAEQQLLELVAAGRARRVPCGDDALWQHVG
jgi:protein-disulfide isomerase-like protein with CxxC motif